MTFGILNILIIISLLTLGIAALHFFLLLHLQMHFGIRAVGFKTELTLALWCMFAQVFPLFQDKSRFSVLTSVYADGYMDPTVPPTNADPTMQGIIAIIALVANVCVFASIIKRAKEQKKNPYKNEIFTDQKDYKLALERAAEKARKAA